VANYIDGLDVFRLANDELIRSKSTEILLALFEQQEVQGSPQPMVVAHEFSLTDEQLRDVLNHLQDDLLYISRSGHNYASLTELGKVAVERML